ncbi:MAG TPA: hypothetical protein DCM02_05720 [Flavobacterium sp.]|nr:hypothetical protein [Flavobacterium sp.]HAT77657.1 hypothetical protein [Flavobacterium sp.]
METVQFKSKSKKDMNLLVNLAKKMGIEVEKINPKVDFIDENSPEYELKVERNLGLMMIEGMKSGIASKEEVYKILNKWK